MKIVTIKNPVVEGWMADPEARWYEGKCWVYVTHGRLNLTAFSSYDLVNWEKHENIIDMEGFPWVYTCVWAPTVIDHNGKYYLIFASNDIQSDEAYGGLELGVSDSPKGPFKRVLDGPLIKKFINGAQPIDAHLFKDDDSVIHLYYGGWGHCNVARLNDSLTGFVPFEDGMVFKEITPPKYTEAPCMLKKDGIYYFQWSNGEYGNDSYGAWYCSSDSPLGPFDTAGPLLVSQPPVAEGPGHHGFIYYPPADEWLAVYHRRYVADPQIYHRILCIDRMKFGGGKMEVVRMTDEWNLEVKNK